MKNIEEMNKELLKMKNGGMDLDGISDGYHTFEELYFHRMVMFSLICNTHRGLAWKSKLHHDGTMYDNYFIVGLNTPMGQYSYHYDLKYWDKFNVQVLDKAPEWDGHKPEDIERLLSLENYTPEFLNMPFLKRKIKETLDIEIEEI